MQRARETAIASSSTSGDTLSDIVNAPFIAYIEGLHFTRTESRFGALVMRFSPLQFSILLLLALGVALPSFAADPQWLWSNGDPGENETCFFRKTFELKGKPKGAVFAGSCDNDFTLFVNGQM